MTLRKVELDNAQINLLICALINERARCDAEVTRLLAQPDADTKEGREVIDFMVAARDEAQSLFLTFAFINIHE